MVNSSLYNLLYKGGQNGGAKIKSSFTNFSSLLNDKKGLMIMVFANLITQLGITYYVMTNTKVTEKDNHNLKHLLLIISTFIIIWILALVPMPSWLKFILFSAFSYIWGILLASFKLKINDNNLINMTMLGSIGIFAVMFLIGGFLLATGIKLGLKTGAFLFFSLLLLIIFSGYIIYDTNIILQRDYYGDFITASLDYYLDILNIFLKLTVLNDN
jgi:FtsH-binding integral membrane protein